ncbi:phenylalanine--tRNA ligase subunit alpha [Acetilactobacillus jinshanensis]|uniref:Phenylalanine--tRNA ligase alpha subunit n=1 Tax=Acetilactobacillus jinshanensis TaxID=1720083 RepID=A0A4P6ZLH1_9LACO|nr:phenylalanine--tRNA ligase subunit alpha [Acetilactobacillus jinshanensis]QBP18656.1 phenylalanine--tRNA ligase subunit alpha [Acetilactobacillus jinshanensis]
MSLKDQLTQLRDKGLSEIKQATDLKTLNQKIRVQLLGKKGPIVKTLRGIGKLPVSQRPIVGKYANQVKGQLFRSLKKRNLELAKAKLNDELKAEKIDVTLPGKPVKAGHPHLIQVVMDHICDLFIGMGYEVLNGNEVETDEYNFERMNLPKHHPARDMQATFYITPDKNLLLRTQTSGMQARTLEKHDFSKGPLKMISPGVVFRRDNDDATHSHQFHQMEGLVVGKHVTMADLKGTLEFLIHKMFGNEFDIRLRPSYFPFTDPSVEVDMTCFNCGGKGCSVCKGTGWIEMLGAGVVHPNVLKNAGLDPHKLNGFAFGLGIDRFAMLKYGVDDIRDFYLNDMRFLSQFD